MNKVILIGRAATEPELKYTPSGIAVSNFRIAVNRPFRNAQGETEVDFIDVVSWRQAAEFASKYLTKGRLIAVEGRLQVRSYQAQDGTRRRTYEVVSDMLRALDKPKARVEAPDEAPLSDGRPVADEQPVAAGFPDPFEGE